MGTKTERSIGFARRMRRNPTKAERLLWNRLRGARADGLRFRRQEPIGPFIVDLVCHEAKLVVEVDGENHTWQLEADTERADWLRSEGFEILRFKNDQVLFQTRACHLGILNAAYRRLDRLRDHVDELPTW